MSTDVNIGASGAIIARNDRMAIEYRPNAKLVQGEGAPRRYSKADIKRSVAILRKFGLRLPLLIRRDGQVLGHFIIVIAARQLGYDEVPVIVVDDLSPDECDALSIALDRLYESGKFDRELLGAKFLALELSTPHITIEDMGFSISEGDLAIEAVTEGKQKVEPPVHIAPFAVSTPGDIWLCGHHRVGCGDAADPEWLALLRDDKPVDMVFTDKPYGCAVSGFVTTRKHREFVQLSGDDAEERRPELFRAWCDAIATTVRPGAIVFLCMDWRGFADLHASASAVFGNMLNLVVWNKDRAGMGSLYRSQHELILVFRAPGVPHRNNVELGKHGRHRTNVWTYPSAKTFATTGTEGDLLADHATPKNKEMIADAILDVTKRGDVVFDPFLGSGSTLIAADKVGRVCHGGDLDPLFVDVAIRRWQAWSSKQAVHLQSGRSFDDIEAERCSLEESHDHE
jgi:DNA modification methylase